MLLLRRCEVNKLINLLEIDGKMFRQHCAKAYLARQALGLRFVVCEDHVNLLDARGCRIISSVPVTSLTGSRGSMAVVRFTAPSAYAANKLILIFISIYSID